MVDAVHGVGQVAMAGGHGVHTRGRRARQAKDRRCRHSLFRSLFLWRPVPGEYALFGHKTP